MEFVILLLITNFAIKLEAIQSPYQRINSNQINCNNLYESNLVLQKNKPVGTMKIMIKNSNFVANYWGLTTIL